MQVVLVVAKIMTKRIHRKNSQIIGHTFNLAVLPKLRISSSKVSRAALVAGTIEVVLFAPDEISATGPGGGGGGGGGGMPPEAEDCAKFGGIGGGGGGGGGPGGAGIRFESDDCDGGRGGGSGGACGGGGG